MEPLKRIRIFALAVAFIDLLCWYLSLWYRELELLRGAALRFLQTWEEAGTKPEVSPTFFPVEPLGATKFVEIVVKLATVCALLRACHQTTPTRVAISCAKVYRTYALFVILQAAVLYLLVAALGDPLQFSDFQQLSFFLRLISLGVVHLFVKALQKNVRQRQRLAETKAHLKN